MAYGTITAPAAGAKLPVDVIATNPFPRTKISWGAEGSATDVSASAPLPVQTPDGLATDAGLATVVAAIEAIPGGGDATAANQDEQTALLTSIDASLGGPLAVTGTFWQATQPVSIAGTVAVSGALTDTQLRASPVPVSGTFYQTTQPVSAAALPLPSGASTAANQTIIIGHVDGIETLLGTIGTETTSAAILAKLPAAPATEAKQDAQIALSTLSAGTDRSGSITTGATAQQLAASNAARRSLTVQNISSGDLWVNEIGANAAADTAGSWKVPAGSVFTTSTNRAISIVGATTGQKFTATEI